MSRRQQRIKYVVDIDYGDGDEVGNDDPWCVSNLRTRPAHHDSTRLHDVQTERIKPVGWETSHSHACIVSERALGTGMHSPVQTATAVPCSLTHGYTPFALFRRAAAADNLADEEHAGAVLSDDPVPDGQGQRHLRHLRLPRDVVRHAQEAEAPRRPHRVRQDGAAGCAPAVPARKGWRELPPGVCTLPEEVAAPGGPPLQRRSQGKAAPKGGKGKGRKRPRLAAMCRKSMK